MRANSLVGRNIVPFVNGDEPISRTFLLGVFFELGDRRERVAVRGVRVIDECNASLERASGKGQSQADQADIPHRRAPQPTRIRRTVSNQPESGRHLASAPRGAQVARNRRRFVRLLHERARAAPFIQASGCRLSTHIVVPGRPHHGLTKNDPGSQHPYGQRRLVNWTSLPAPSREFLKKPKFPSQGKGYVVSLNTRRQYIYTSEDCVSLNQAARSLPAPW